MNDLLDDIGETLAHLGRSWRRTPAGDRLAVDDLADAELVALNESLGAARRRFDAVHSRIASEIARRSRPEHGAEGLAKKNGYRTPVTLIAATTGTTVGEAAKLVSVGEATAPRRMFSGEDAPARHPFVAAALAAGEIGMPASSAIITMLDRIAMRVDRPTLDDAERTLIAQAHGLALDQLAKVITRAEAYLDPDGLQPHESEMRQMRSLRFFEREGMLCIDGKFDPVSGAPIRTAPWSPPNSATRPISGAPAAPRPTPTAWTAGRMLRTSTAPPAPSSTVPGARSATTLEREPSPSVTPTPCCSSPSICSDATAPTSRSTAPR